MDGYFLAEINHFTPFNLQPSPYLFTTLCLI